jgi:hypothetical protein
MSWRTTLLLLLLVAAIGSAAWWQGRRERSYVEGAFVPLFEGVDVARIRSMRLEALDRPPGVRFERDARGEWLITDPIAYPARQAMIDELLGIVRRNQAQEASEVEIASRDHPFERLGIFEVDETLEDGRNRTTRIEVGDVDLDGMRLWIRRDGRIYRTLRNLETMLERNLQELRSDRIFALVPTDVVRVTRTGVDIRKGTVSSLDMEARRDVYAWKLVSPYEAQLDPSLFALYIASLTSLKVKEFVDDEATALGPYGLSAPQVSLTIEDRYANEQNVIFAQAVDSGVWYANRKGLPFVWQLEDGGSLRLFEPLESFLDEQLVRVFRDDVQKVEILSERGMLTLVRDRSGREARWMLSTHEAASGAETEARPADLTKVEEILGTLEHGELRHLLAEDPAARFPAGSPRRGVWIEDVRGIRQGGRIGEAYTWEDGTQGALFLRDEEDVVAFVPAAVAKLLDVKVEEVASLRLLELDETRQRRLTLAAEGREQIYVRSTEGAWRHETSGLEATELRAVLDGILFLRASEFVAVAAESMSLEKPVRVEFDDAYAKHVEVTLGLDKDGRAVATAPGGLAVLADPTIHAKLLALFQE